MTKLTKTQAETLTEIRDIYPDGATVRALDPFPQPTVQALFRKGALVRVAARRGFGNFGGDTFTL